MRTLFTLLASFVVLMAGAASLPAPAPNLAGAWQGTLQGRPQGPRILFQFSLAKTGGWSATMFVDNTNPIPVQSVTVGRATIEIFGNAGRYQGEISADGTSIRGTWTRGNPRVLEGPVGLELKRATAATAWILPPDSSPHTIRFITVDKDTNLEVLDWGGTGRPLVLLAGLGNDAHVFDQFAPKLTPRYHVYGITRRAFGNSSAPLTGYSADRLGDDVLAVLDALHLERPILAGHSIGGEELSSIGSRYPQRVAGLIYLDAGHPYAYYDASVGTDSTVAVALDVLERKLDRLKIGKVPGDPSAVIKDLLDTELPAFTQALLARQRNLQALPAEIRASLSSAPAAPLRPLGQDYWAGLQKYPSIHVPILAIFAAPHELPPTTPNDPAARAAADATADKANRTMEWVDAFEKGEPTARVVRLAHANHYVFRSNEADVLREMDAFIGGLPR